MPDAATIGACTARARRLLPRHEAELLLCRALDIPRSHIFAFPERSVAARDDKRLAAWLARRQKGEPVAYILGERGFWGLDLMVTPAVLIPRPDTETLVAAALPLIAAGARVLDLGTGSGAVALAIASERPDVQIVASDIDPQCVAVCQRNAERLDLRVETRVAARFEGIQGHFHVVVSNPPYVAADDHHLQRGDLRFEPRHALVGGERGIDFIEVLLREAPRHLLPGGWLCVEHGCDQDREVRGLFEENGFAGIRSHRDLGGHPRVTTARLP